MKKLNQFIVLSSLLFLFASCDNNDQTSSSGKASISARSVYSGATSRMSSNGLTLSSFKINFKEIKFELIDNDNDENNNSYYDDDFQLNGPFEFDILNGAKEISLANIPNGEYEKVEFKMDMNDNTISPMFNKSIEIKGTINGTPFIFWHNIEEVFKIDYENTSNNIIVDGNTVNVTFNFDLNSVINNTNLTVAMDGNNDGLIEISPNDPDGNQSLANLIKNKIKEFTDLN